MTAKKRAARHRHASTSLSLAPLTVDEALAALLKTPPPSKSEKSTGKLKRCKGAARKGRHMKRSHTSGAFTFDFEKTDGGFTVSVKNQGGQEVATGRGDSCNAAAHYAAVHSDNESLKLTVRQTVFPEF